MRKILDIDELAETIRGAINRGRSVRGFGDLLAEEREAYRDAVQAVLNKLNQPEPLTLTQVQHLKLMAEIGKQTHGYWWQCLRSAMKSQWIQPVEYLPEPVKPILIRKKTEAVEEAQFDGTNFHQHSRPDMIIYTYGISEWTYLYEPDEQQ